jgi:hypothetical protein
MKKKIIDFSLVLNRISSGIQGIVAVVLVSFVLSCSSRQVLKKDAAMDCLKILNGDLINLLNNAAERPEIKALKFLFSQESAPFPYMMDSLHKSAGIKEFNFKDRTGIYSWNEISKEFKKTGDTAVIVILFPLPGDAVHKVEVLISDFSQGIISSRTDFPILINAVLLIDGEEALAISHIAAIEDKLPLSVNSSVIGKGYSFNFNFLRNGKISGKSGSINANFSFIAGFTEEIQSHFKADILYNGNTYSYKKILFDQKMFDTSINGIIDFGKINKAGSYTIDDFNKNSTIVVSSIKYKKEICAISLCKLPGNSINNYCMVFSDGSAMPIGDQFVSFDKLLNLMEIIKNLR